MQILRTRPLWILIIALRALLLLTGVAYAVGNLLGYVYVPQANAFFPADATLAIRQPVLQQHDGRSVTVQQGLAVPGNVTIWLDFSDTARRVDGAVLKTPDGKSVALSYWEYAPNQPASRGVRMTFAPLPPGTSMTTLSLPEGWQIPLEWIPLASAQKTTSAPSNAPYPLAATPTPTIIPTAQAPCVASHQIQLCVLSATQSAGKTIVLVGAKTLGGQLSPGSDFPGMLVWQDEKSSIVLVDAQGHTLPLENAEPDQSGTAPLDGSTAQLTFTGVPADGQPVKLSLPGFYASMPVDLSVTVDLGKDPQPGTLPVDSDIPLFGQTVRFRIGTLLGDGTSSLRLYLKSEPIAVIDAVEPYSVQLGRPDRVDDLYGAGPLAGKGLFVELFQYSKKLTGKLVLPITNATAVIHGPFVFDVTVSSPPPITATPLVADPNTFAPAPTTTPLALDSYAYAGGSLNTGDLLYTVFAGSSTQLFAFTPGIDQSSRLVATLPGAVAQVYLHPDHLGIDYMAGTQVTKDGFHFIDYVRLYTLRFSDPAPRLLYSFPPNSQNSVGTSAIGEWSFDGHYAIFVVRSTTAGSSFVSSSTQYAWLDLSCRETGDCALQPIPIPSNLELDSPAFAPDNYQVLFSGLDNSGTGKEDAFLLDFDPRGPAKPIVDVTANLTLSDSVIPPPAWTSDKKIFTICSNGALSDTNTFCMIDPATRSVTAGQPISPNLKGYRLFGGLWLSPSGKQLAAIVIPVDATRASLPELRLLDLDGHLGTLITKSQSLIDGYQVAFSPSGQYLAYLFENGQTLEAFDTSTGQRIPVYHGAQAWLLSWLGWVP